MLKIEGRAGEHKFVKINPDITKSFSWIGLTSDILTVSTLVAGVNAEMRLQAGQGSLGDVLDKVKGEDAREKLNSDGREFYHHIMMLMSKEKAKKELITCCSSERASRL